MILFLQIYFDERSPVKLKDSKNTPGFLDSLFNFRRVGIHRVKYKLISSHWDIRADSEILNAIKMKEGNKYQREKHGKALLSFQ